jgi:hypothetical protein
VGSQRAHIQNATVSLSLQLVVVLLRPSDSVRHCATAVCNSPAVQTTRVGPIGSKFEKCASFSGAGPSPLISAGIRYGEYNTCSSCEAAHCSRSPRYAYARNVHPPLGIPFSTSSGIVAKQQMGGFSTLFNCAQHVGCRCDEACSRDNLSRQIRKTCAVRGQRRPRICYCRHPEMSDTVMRPMLPMQLLSRAFRRRRA